MNRKRVAALVAVAAAVGLLLMGRPTVEERVSARAPELQSRLETRRVHIHPAELLDVINNYNTRLRIVDVRDESDFNLFHILDSVRVPWARLQDPAWVRALPTHTVTVLVSNDERRAEEAWKRLAVQNVPHLYVLEGGINGWLDLYGEAPTGAVSSGSAAGHAAGDDTLRHGFSAALGSRHPASDPDPLHAPRVEYERKVKPIGPTVRKAGGCG